LRNTQVFSSRVVVEVVEWELDLATKDDSFFSTLAGIKIPDFRKKDLGGAVSFSIQEWAGE
jgi:hypothetical protein